ncbi:MAG: response regulator transcription factor, partial [Bacteroidetes bacterium]|nr:response regulator transcription factor [Bacteroidota bacterium]
MITVLIADDHQVLIDGLKTMLDKENDIMVIGQASDGEEVFDRLKEQQPDVILLDINMPKMDGIDACKRITKEYPESKVLALTMYGEGSFITSMLKSGAKGYILKNSSKDQLIQAIKSVNAGENYYSQEVTKILISSLMPGKTISSNPLFPKITRREKEILKLIMEEYTTQEIA